MKRHKKAAFTITELLVVVSIFLLMLMAMAPFVKMAKDRSHRINCANNLMRISLGLHAYALDHNDTFPSSLGELYPNYVEGETVFDCPASMTIGTKEKPDYSYKQALTEASSANEIIVQDLEDNHKKHGKNVLRINGKAEWVSAGRGR